MMHEREDGCLVFIDGPLKVFLLPASKVEVLDAWLRVARLVNVAADNFDKVLPKPPGPFDLDIK